MCKSGRSDMVFSFKQSILYRNAFLKLLCSFCTACFGSLPQGLQQCQLQLCVAWCRVDFVFFRPSQNLFPQSPDRRVDGPEHIEISETLAACYQHDVGSAEKPAQLNRGLSKDYCIKFRYIQWVTPPPNQNSF